MAKDEIKVFKISGTYMKDFIKYVFSKEKRALKQEHALEDVISEISSIGVKRSKIKITSIKELKPEEISDLFVQSLIEKQ